jgi:hypothetical protein
MRKIRKIISGLTFLGLGLLTTSTCVIMTSCKSIIDKNRDFIMEHTISLMVSGVQSDGQPAGSQAIATA